MPNKANPTDVPSTSNATITTRKRSKHQQTPQVLVENNKRKKKEEGTVEKDGGEKRKQSEEDDKYLAPIHSIFSKQKLIKTEELKNEIKSTKEALEGQYNEIKADYDELVEEELNEFSAFMEKKKQKGHRNIYRENVIKQNGYIVSYPRGPLPDNDIKMSEVTVTRIEPDRNENGVVQKKVRAPCSCIEVGDISPKMNYWIPIEQSIISKDQRRLTYMPNFGDGKDNRDMFDALIKEFHDGVHGFSRNWSDINDYLLYKLLRATLPNFKGKPDVLYFALYSMYPNKTSQRELSSVFPELCAKFAELNFDPAPLEPWKPQKVQEVAGNAQDPQCYACLHHMCAVHGFKAELSPELPGGEYFHCELPLPNSVKTGEPKCSKNCWKSLRMGDVRKYMQLNKLVIEEKKIPIYLKKHNIMKMKVEDGSTIASMYGYNNKVPFCEFAATAVDEYDDECAIRSCRDAYKLILSIAAKVEDRRLIASEQPRKLSWLDRFKNFCIVQYRLATQKKKERHEKLRLQALEDNTDVADLIAEDDRREAEQSDEAIRLTAVTKITACRHNGPCFTSEDCACRDNGVCSHLCSCDINCNQRFPGCNCEPGKCESKKCCCYRAKWECNPLTCASCNCDEIGTGDRKCKNFSMTQMIQKKMISGPSQYGNGLFMLQSVEKNEFLTEYVGEKISDEEVERRGVLYNRSRCSYIFNLATGGAIDAYKVGNLARFANHDAKNPSCYAKTMVVAGEHRIGFYAKRRLEFGDEVTFDYGYSEEHQKAFGMANTSMASSSSTSSSIPSSSKMPKRGGFPSKASGPSKSSK